MDRRTFIGTLAGGLLAAPLAAEGQQAQNMRRIGVIVPVEPASPTEPNVAAFRQRMRSLGYVEGQNIAIDYRYAHGKDELYPDLAADLIRLKVDIMVVGSWQPALAAKKLTQEIPIVGIGMGPIPSGLGLWQASTDRVVTSRGQRGLPEKKSAVSGWSCSNRLRHGSCG